MLWASHHEYQVHVPAGNSCSTRLQLDPQHKQQAAHQANPTETHTLWSVRIAVVICIARLPLMPHCICLPRLLLLLAAAAGTPVQVGDVGLQPEPGSRSIFQAAQRVLRGLRAAAIATTAEHAVEPPASETVCVWCPTSPAADSRRHISAAAAAVVGSINKVISSRLLLLLLWWQQHCGNCCLLHSSFHVCCCCCCSLRIWSMGHSMSTTIMGGSTACQRGSSSSSRCCWCHWCATSSTQAAGLAVHPTRHQQVCSTAAVAAGQGGNQHTDAP